MASCTGHSTRGEAPIRTPPYDVSARRRNVSFTQTADVAARATLREEIREATRITDELVARNGMPFPEFSMFSPNEFGDDTA